MLDTCAAARQRSRRTAKRVRPGARGSKGLAPLRCRLTVKRVAVAATGAAAGCVMRRQGVSAAPAAKLKRRAGVSPTSSKTPHASPRLLERKPSSSACSASSARAVSTTSTSSGSMPSCLRPCAESRPYSAANARVVHHRSHGLPAWKEPPFSPCAARASIRLRRTASRKAKPSPAIQSPADAPEGCAEAFTSCTPAPSRPCGNR